MHMVEWSTVTLPKDLGGLGLQSMKDRNLAILAKLCWRLASDQGAPWAQMLAAKYLTPQRLEQGRSAPCSSVLVACKKGDPIYVKGLKWAVRNGESINVWLDFWLPISRLRNLIEGPLNRDEDQVIVNQCFDNECVWRSQSISFEIPDQILNVIKATPLSVNQNTEDTLHWAFSKDGIFSLKSAYLLARNLNSLNLETNPIAWVWKVEAPPKIQFFLWLCLHYGLPLEKC